MSLFVDTKNVSSENNHLVDYIKEYRENSQEIFFEISKLYNYWKDDSTSLFQEKIREEEISCLLIVETLEKISDFYKNVENIYENMN